MNIARCLVACIASAFALAGCPVDSRKLTGSGGSAGRAMPTAGRPSSGGAPGGQGGESDAGTAGTLAEGGQPEVAGAAGEAGAGPVSVPIVDGCVDLDLDHVGDCTQSLLKNSGFKLDTADWTGDVGAKLTWSDSNAFADLPSGSAVVASALGPAEMDGLILAVAGQCIPIASGENLEIMANLFIKSGQGQGLAGISVFFFDMPDCMGSIKDSFDTSGGATDTWFTLRGTHTVAEGVSSMRMRLTVARPYRSASFEAQFDNVLVRSQ
jgi:hypothetical protein